MQRKLSKTEVKTMNKVILMGRLTRDPDIRYSQGENAMAIARFTLAVNRRIKKDSATDQQTADFISCIAFGKTAEFYEKYTHQGIKLVVEGRIQTGSYTNKEGVKVYTTEVVVENTEFAESKNSTESGTASARPEPENITEDGFMNIPDDDALPFS